MLRHLGAAAVALALAALVLTGLTGCTSGHETGEESAADNLPIVGAGGGTANTDEAPTDTEAEEKPKTYKPPTEAEVQEAKKVGKYQVIVETERGQVELELDGKAAPLHVANFVKLANAEFYDGLVFHRVVSDPPVVQTGDPKGDASGPGYTIKAEQSPLKHDTGALGMARSRHPDSAGSQWYITRAPAHFLDQGVRGPGYVVFGRVVKGMDVVKKIKEGDKMKSVSAKPKRDEKKENPDE